MHVCLHLCCKLGGVGRGGVCLVCLSVSVSWPRLALGTKTEQDKSRSYRPSGGSALSRDLALGQSMGGGRHGASRGELVSRHLGNLLGVLCLAEAYGPLQIFSLWLLSGQR